MDSSEVIKAVVEDSELSMYAVSGLMGRSRLYIGQAVSAKRIPTIRTMAEICEATGHDLLIRNRKTGREITIDPPKKESNED